MGIKNVVDSWKFSMLLLYILWNDWPIFMISDSNEQLQQQLKYTLLNPDCHSWWISKMQAGREDTLKERYAMLQTAFWPSCMNRASVFEWHKRFKEGRESVRDDETCGGSVRKSIYQSWLAKGLGLLCWGFKGVQKEIPSEEASTLQIGSEAFPPGQCTSLQLHPCQRLFDQDGHQNSSSPSLLSRLCSLWLLLISLISEAVVMRQLRRWKRLWRRSLKLSHMRTSMGSSRSCWNDSTSALQPEEITSKGTRVLCVYYQ